MQNRFILVSIETTCTIQNQSKQRIFNSIRSKLLKTSQKCPAFGEIVNKLYAVLNSITNILLGTYKIQEKIYFEENLRKLTSDEFAISS